MSGETVLERSRNDLLDLVDDLRAAVVSGNPEQSDDLVSDLRRAHEKWWGALTDDVDNRRHAARLRLVANGSDPDGDLESEVDRVLGGAR